MNVPDFKVRAILRRVFRFGRETNVNQEFLLDAIEEAISLGEREGERRGDRRGYERGRRSKRKGERR